VKELVSTKFIDVSLSPPLPPSVCMCVCVFVSRIHLMYVGNLVHGVAVTRPSIDQSLLLLSTFEERAREGACLIDHLMNSVSLPPTSLGPSSPLSVFSSLSLSRSSPSACLPHHPAFSLEQHAVTFHRTRTVSLHVCISICMRLGMRAFGRECRRFTF